MPAVLRSQEVRTLNRRLVFKLARAGRSVVFSHFLKVGSFVSGQGEIMDALFRKRSGGNAQTEEEEEGELLIAYCHFSMRGGERGEAPAFDTRSRKSHLAHILS